MAVLIPNNCPLESTSAPPELPGLMARVGLNEILEGVDAELAAAHRADDARGDRLADAERIADRQHDVTDARLIGLPEENRRQLRHVNLEHRQIGFRIGADHARLGPARIRERDLDLVCRLHHMAVREDVTLFAHDDPGPEIRAPARLGIEALTEEMAEHRVVHERLPLDLRFLGRVDVHDRGHRAPGGIAQR
jgi:hypothetical protein